MKRLHLNSLQAWLFLTGPGVRYVPAHVWRSKFFWVALAVMVVGILIYHNTRKNKHHGRHF
jgi:hypothetical protein